MERYFSATDADCEVQAFEPTSFIASGDQVIVIGTEKVRAKRTGRSYETHWIHAFRLARPAQIDLANILAASAERWGASGQQRYAAVLAAAMRQVADEPEDPLTKKRPSVVQASVSAGW